MIVPAITGPPPPWVSAIVLLAAFLLWLGGLKLLQHFRSPNPEHLRKRKRVELVTKNAGRAHDFRNLGTQRLQVLVQLFGDLLEFSLLQAKEEMDFL